MSVAEKSKGEGNNSHYFVAGPLLSSFTKT